MVKSIVSISVDTEIYKAVRTKFPRQVSQLCEEALKNYLGSEMDFEDIEDKSILLEEMNKTNEQIASLKAKRALLENNIKKKEDNEQKILDEEFKTAHDEYFELPESQRLEIAKKCQRAIDRNEIEQDISPVLYYKKYIKKR